MDISLAKPQEKTNIKDLWEYCFDDTEEFVNWFFDTRYESNNTLVLREDDNVASALQLLPYEIALRNRVLPTSYMVGVSTWPKYRGRGYIRRLLLESLKTMRARGQGVSILLPFDYGFYGKYGWSNCYSYGQYRGSRDAFIRYLDGIELEGEITPIRPDQDLEELDKCYLSHTSTLNGYIRRDREDWDRILTDVRIDGGDGYIYRRGGWLVGYMLLSKSGTQLLVRSMFSVDAMGYKEILKYAIHHTPEAQDILLSHSLEESARPGILESGIQKLEKPFVMGRIVDVEMAFKGMTVDGNMDLVIEVIDPILQWNNQRFAFLIEDSRLTLIPTTEHPHMVIHISALSQLLWGFYTPWQALGYGLFKIEDMDRMKMLDALFPKTTPYIYEDY